MFTMGLVFFILICAAGVLAWRDHCTRKAAQTREEILQVWLDSASETMASALNPANTDTTREAYVRETRASLEAMDDILRVRLDRHVDKLFWFDNWTKIYPRRTIR